MGGRRTNPSGTVFHRVIQEPLADDEHVDKAFADLEEDLLAAYPEGEIEGIQGLGAKWRARLADLGISSLVKLAYADPHELASLEALSLERAQGWVQEAEAKLLALNARPEELPVVSETEMPEQTSNPPSLIEAPEEAMGFEVIDRASLAGKRHYALLDKLPNEWRVITRPIADYDVPPHPYYTFGMARPTFQWVKDGKVVEIYVDGMDEFAFYEALGLEVDLKNATTTAKRISRLFRPQAVTGFFESENFNRRYLDEVFPEGTSVNDAKTWDGAGIVSRKMLLKMIEQLPEDLDPRSRARLERELRHAQRVEFTIMTENGQEKGHAIVAENLEEDFVLPRDLKKQVKLKRDQSYVALEFPHGAEDMRLDIQSLINLHPFFDEKQLRTWMRQEGEVFMDAVQSGDIAEAMRRVDGYTTVEDLEQWSLREFLVSGGDIHWSGSHVKSFFRSAIKRLQKMGDGGQWDEEGKFVRDGKIKMPIPGGRHYVMPAAVGRAAGKDIQVGRGEVYVDEKAGTAWVNDEDWVELGDGAAIYETNTDGTKVKKPQGIAEILGGADNDDALWVHHFTDHDGQKKTMIWRSPNQTGEYMILKPHEASAQLAWQTRDGAVVFPEADSRKLPKRRDHQEADGELKILGLIPQVDPEADTPDSGSIVDAMRRAAEREKTNKDILGATCNWMMIRKAVTGAAPKEVPDLLETIIDLKKTGYHGGEVLHWVQQDIGKMLDAKQAVPEILHSRLGRRQAGTPNARSTIGHWMDELQEGFREQLEILKTARQDFAEDTMPPMEIFEFVHESHQAAQNDPSQADYYRLGKQVNGLYYQTLNAPQNKGKGIQALDAARERVEAFVRQYPADVQEGIMLGTLLASYAKDDATKSETSGFDGVAWLMGAKDASGKRQAGLSNLTLQGLRRLGVINELHQGKEGIDSYPPAQYRDRSHRTAKVDQVHRAFFDFAAEKEGRRLYLEYDENNPQDLAERKIHASEARKRVEQFARSGQTVNLEVRKVSMKDRHGKDRERLVLFSSKTGKQFGLINSADQARFREGESLLFKGGFSRGGDIAAFIQRLGPALEDDD